MKISALLGKKVLSTSGRQGYVLSVSADKDGRIFMLCADEKEREFYINCEDVRRFGERVIFEERAFIPAGGAALKLGRAAYDGCGRLLGRVEDYTFSGGKLKSAKIGKKNYPAEELTLGDAVLVREVARLKSDVVKDGEALFLKGTPVTRDVLERAAAAGEYVQTRLKSL